MCCPHKINTLILPCRALVFFTENLHRLADLALSWKLILKICLPLLEWVWGVYEICFQQFAEGWGLELETSGTSSIFVWYLSKLASRICLDRLLVIITHTTTTPSIARPAMIVHMMPIILSLWVPLTFFSLHGVGGLGEYVYCPME